MNTRSCLLTVGVSALLATGSVVTAAPASAAPGSAECLAAQSALSTQLGVASVDIALANQLRDAMTSLDAIGAQLEPLYAAADLSLADELATLDEADLAVWETSEAEGLALDTLTAAEAAEASALLDLEAALQAVEDAEADGDEAALAAAEAERDRAQEVYDDAIAETLTAEADLAAAAQASVDAAAAYQQAEAAFQASAEIAYGTPEILALEAEFDAVVASFDDAFTRLGLTEGSDPEELLALADAAIAACSADAVPHTPVVRAAAPQRGLNIQTAAHDADTTGPANLALLAGLAGFGAAATAGAVVVRRRGTGRL